MSKHKEIYVTHSHTKKVFANMKRQGKDVSGSGHHSLLFQPILFQKLKRQKPVTDDTENVASVPTHSNDPLLSVIDLEKTKTSQATEISELKERVKRLEKKGGSRTYRLKRLYKVGRSARVVSFKDEGMGDQQDASKQRMKIDEIDQDAKAKDKGKAKMVEPEKPLKKKYQIMFDKEDDVQAMMDADYELSARLQAEEQGELTIKEKSRLFVELMNKRKKHFARIKVEEQRRKPPTKAQTGNTMSTYVKNVAGYKHNQLKTKSFEDLQMLFDIEMKRVNIFVDMDTELVKGSETKIEGSSKRAGEEFESETLKKQKLDENVEAKVDDDQEEAEMKKHMEIVPDDEVAIDAIPLATKPPITSIDREDLETLWKLVKAKHGLTRPEEGYERVLWGNLKVIFEPDVESEVWRNLQGHKVTVWKLFSSSGVHFVRFQNLHIFMLVEKRYLLTPATITKMLNNAQQEALS
ncbi:hypothetical protein Tco_0462119 [Tanacetum coccineum]